MHRVTADMVIRLDTVGGENAIVAYGPTLRIDPTPAFYLLWSMGVDPSRVTDDGGYILYAAVELAEEPSSFFSDGHEEDASAGLALTDVGAAQIAGRLSAMLASGNIILSPQQPQEGKMIRDYHDM